MIGEWNIDDTNKNNFPYFDGKLYVKYPFGELRFTGTKKEPLSPAIGVKKNIYVPNYGSNSNNNN